jgi:branched-chain amino acid transport system substrate-binding protein
MKNQILGVLIASGLTLLGCTKNSTSENANEIKIGEFGAMTGPEATFGQSTDKAIRLALDAVNAAGGVNGKKIRLITEDDQGKTDEAAAVVKKLITQDQVVAILGEVASSRSRAAASIAQQFKIPMITPSSTNPEVTRGKDYVFRVCFIDPFQGSVLAQFAVKNLKAKKVAVLKDLKSDYSLGLTEFFMKKYKELGGKITSVQNYQAGDTDFKAQLTDIRGEKPDVLFIPGYYTDVGLIARQAKQLGLKAVMLGGDGWDSPKLFEIGGAAIQGAYFSTHYTTSSPDEDTQKFIKAYKEKYNEIPDSLAALGYDAALILVDALKNAKDLSAAEIRDAIAKTKDFKGVTGKITIDADHNADKNAVVVQVEGNELKFVTSIGR